MDRVMCASLFPTLDSFGLDLSGFRLACFHISPQSSESPRNDPQIGVWKPDLELIPFAEI